jgi:hypothetical protein
VVAVVERSQEVMAKMEVLEEALVTTLARLELELAAKEIGVVLINMTPKVVHIQLVEVEAQEQ